MSIPGVCGVFTLLLLAGQTHAGEMLAYGKVLRVLPISSQKQLVETVGDCYPRKPHKADLADLLAWDLRTHCRTVRRTVDVVTGYRVYFQWDGRIYDTVVADPPGDTIPLKVMLN